LWHAFAINGNPAIRKKSFEIAASPTTSALTTAEQIATDSIAARAISTGASGKKIGEFIHVARVQADKGQLLLPPSQDWIEPKTTRRSDAA
jgi:hypothetical protein